MTYSYGINQNYVSSRYRGFAKRFQEKHPKLAELLRGPVVTKARELGVLDRYPRDRRALGVARDEFFVVRREFKTSPHTPDLVQRYWQGRWNYLGRRVGLSTSELEIPEHGYFQDEIDGLEQEMLPRRKLAYGSDRFYQTPEGLIDLSRIHPKMRAWVDKPDTDLTRVTHSSNKGGWFHIESDWQAPFINTTQEGAEEVLEQLRKEFPSFTWRGGRLPSYMIASEDGYDLNRHHYDENGWVRLLGSFVDGRVVGAGFDGSGRLGFSRSWDPLDQDSGLGARFEGAKP